MEERVARSGCRRNSFYRRGVGVVWGFNGLGAWVASGGATGERALKACVWLSLRMAPSLLLNVQNCWRFSDGKKDR